MQGKSGHLGQSCQTQLSRGERALLAPHVLGSLQRVCCGKHVGGVKIQDAGKGVGASVVYIYVLEKTKAETYHPLMLCKGILTPTDK